MNLILTGFEPFGGETVNPSWEAVRALPLELGDKRLYQLRLPVVFGQAAHAVLSAARALNPDAILCVGQAGGRTALTPERVAVNLRQARIPDNAGQQPQKKPVDPEGPEVLFTTLPAERMADAILAAGVPAQVSLSAGAFVCNDLLYTLLRHFEGSETRVGFLHVPYLPEQAKDGQPSLPLEDIIRGLRAAIEAI